jgi:nitrate reductase gamma subunit
MIATSNYDISTYAWTTRSLTQYNIATMWRTIFHWHYSLVFTVFKHTLFVVFTSVLTTTTEVSFLLSYLIILSTDATLASHVFTIKVLII